MRTSNDRHGLRFAGDEGVRFCLVVSLFLLLATNALGHNKKTAVVRARGKYYKVYKRTVPVKRLQAVSAFAMRVRHALGKNREGQFIVPVFHLVKTPRKGPGTAGPADHVAQRTSAREGHTYGTLSEAAKQVADKEVARMVDTARGLEGALPVDGNKGNFRFYEDGHVAGWFDIVHHF